MNNNKFFLKMLIKSMLYKKTRIFTMFLSSVIASFSFFSLFSLYLELPKKFNEAFRNYGANVVFFPKNNKNFKKQDLETITNYFLHEGLVSSSFYSYINTQINLQPVTVVATNIKNAYKTNPFWDINGTLPSKNNEVLIGKELSNLFSLDIDGIFDIKFRLKDGSTIIKKFKVAGILQTGKSEESFVFADYDYISSFFGYNLEINTIEASILQGEKELLKKLDNFNKSHTDIISSPIKNITSSEYKVFNKLKSLIFVVNAFILSIISISLFTVMLSIIREKKGEIAIKKAIGSEDKIILFEFFLVGLFISIFSSIFGIVFGYFCAKEASLRIFSSSISFNFILLIITLIINTVLMLFSCLLPVKKLMNIEVAKTLKGE